MIGERIALLGNDLPQRTVDHRIIILRHWLAQLRHKALGLHGIERHIDPHHPGVRIDDSIGLVVNRLKQPRLKQLPMHRLHHQMLVEVCHEMIATRLKDMKRLHICIIPYYSTFCLIMLY